MDINRAFFHGYWESNSRLFMAYIFIKRYWRTHIINGTHKMEHSLVSWFPCRSMPGKLAKSHRFDLLHNGNWRSLTGDNRGRVRFFSHHFLGLWPGMMVNHLYFACISICIICTSCIYVYKHALQEGCFFLGAETQLLSITDICE